MYQALLDLLIIALKNGITREDYETIESHFSQCPFLKQFGGLVLSDVEERNGFFFLNAECVRGWGYFKVDEKGQVTV